MTNAELLEMLRTGRTQESSLIERKPDGFKDREARKVIVAFANSTPAGYEAVLFVGIHDKSGDVRGVTNPDALQARYAKALQECYPRITYQMHALQFQGKSVLAIVVPASHLKPHFAGGAYIREGSRSVLASEQLYEELILSRSDKTRELLKYRDASTIVSVRGVNYRLGSNKPFSGGGHVEGCECMIEGCDNFRVKLYKLSAQRRFTEDLSRVSISFDDEKNRPLLLVTAPGR